MLCMENKCRTSEIATYVVKLHNFRVIRTVFHYHAIFDTFPFPYMLKITKAT